MDETAAGTGAKRDDEPPSVFGSWRAIYLAVIVCALLSMAAIGVFSSWPW